MKKEDKKVVICDLWSPKNGEVKSKKAKLSTAQFQVLLRSNFFRKTNRSCK